MPPSERAPIVDRGLVKRCAEFMYGLERDASERIVPFAAGYAVLNPSASHDPGFLVVERPGMEAEEIAALAGRVLEPFGAERPAVSILDPDLGADLAPGFEDLGWRPEHGVYQVLRRPPDRAPTAEVREVRHGDLLGLRRAALAEDPWVRERSAGTGAPLEEMVEELIEMERAMTRIGGDRAFVADHRGAPASICQLYTRDGVGMVENVATLERARNRGLARAVVLAAVEASRALGNELTFLGAKQDDWPQALYVRLGFDIVGPEFIFERR